MKKILYSTIVAGLALVSAACQKLDEQTVTFGSNDLTVTASIVNFDGTKVSYAFSDPTNVKSGIKPSWTAGDAIFGFDEAGTTFTFTVESVAQDGKANFNTQGSGSLTGKLYAVYYPGKTIEDIDNKTIAVDLSSQSGKLDGSAPVIMCATGEIKNNAVNFAFTNQTAIVGIYKMQVFKDGEPVGADKTVTAVTLNGAKAKGEIKVEGGVLTLVAGTEDPEGITAGGLSLTTDTDGSVNVAADDIAPYFAVIPDAEASLSITAVCGGSSCKTNAAITGAINPGQYYYLGKKVYGGTVAKIVETEKGYATISEAFAAATNGQTVQLQNNCTVDSKVVVNKNVTLDLNDCILTQDGTKRIGVGENGTLEIRDGLNDGGTINQAAQGLSVFSVSEGVLNIYGGSISKGDDAETNTIVVSDNGTLNVYGGTITNTKKTAIYISGGEVTFDENSTGVVSGINNAIAAEGGKLTIKDGCFAGNGINKYAAIYKVENTEPTIEISGGCYSKAPIEALVKQGSICVANAGEDKDSYPVQVGIFSADNTPATLAVNYNSGTITMGYESIEAAAAEANNASYPCKITLHKKQTLQSAVNVTNKKVEVTLDLNGNELTYDGDSRIRVYDKDAHLIIEDNKSNGEIIQTAAGKGAISHYTGKLTIRGGKISNGPSSTVNTVNLSGGTLNVEGGEITLDLQSKSTITASGGTLNVSGGKISAMATQAPAISMSGDVKVYVKGTGVVTSTSSNAISISGGTLTVEGGEVKNENTTAGINAKAGSVVVKETGKVTSKGNAISMSSGNLTVFNGQIKSTNAKAINVTDGEVTISGGEIVGDTTALYMTKGNLNITGGEFSISSTKANSCKWGVIDLIGTSSAKLGEVRISNANVSTNVGYRAIYVRYAPDMEISSGNFSALRYVVQVGYSSSDDSNLTIKDGTFKNTSNYPVIYNYGKSKTNIEGGYFYRYSGNTVFMTSNHENKILLSGGHCNIDPQASIDLANNNVELVANYVIKDDGEGDYRYYIVKE